jgi:hypothetical protein
LKHRPSAPPHKRQKRIHHLLRGDRGQQVKLDQWRGSPEKGKHLNPPYQAAQNRGIVFALLSARTMRESNRMTGIPASFRTAPRSLYRCTDRHRKGI